MKSNNAIRIFKVLGLTLYINGTATMEKYFENSFLSGIIIMVIGGVIWGITEGMQN